MGAVTGGWEKISPVYRTVFLTIEGYESDQTLKNPLNAGENELEPVVGIEPTTYGLRIRRQFLVHAKTQANVRF